MDSNDEVGQLAMTFNEMQKRLERLDSARREFIANASHELRTPIFSLAGFVELLEDDEPDPEVRAEFVHTMREQIARLTKLTVDLLDLSKLDADAMEIRRELVELGEVARRVAREFAPAAECHDSPIELAAGAATAAGADPDRVAQIMRILIDNALTHTPEGTTIKVGLRSTTARPASSSPTTGPGSSRARASASSSASTRAMTSAARGSASRSPASSRGAWTARSSCARGAGGRSSSCGFRPPPRPGAGADAPRADRGRHPDRGRLGGDRCLRR